MARRVFVLLALALTITAAPTGQAQAQSAPGGRAQGTQLGQAHADWTLPAWTRGGPAAWTMIGAPYAASVALVTRDGRFAPHNHGPAMDFWLYDLDANRLLVPADFTPSLRLDDDFAPIVTSAWRKDDLQVEMTFFAGWPGGDVTTWFAPTPQRSGADHAVTFVRLSVSSSSDTPRHLAAFAALRPYGVEADMHAIGKTACGSDGKSLVADDQTLLTGLQPADACGAASIAAGDLSVLAARNQLPNTSAIVDPDGRAEVAMRTTFTLAPHAPTVLEYRSALGASADIGGGTFQDQRGRVLDAWHAATDRVTFAISDANITSAFRASQVYLLLNRRGDWPRSGPLAHDASWVRDAAYIGQALERAGFATDNQSMLEAFASTQRDDGSVPAIVDNAGARPTPEWDADGELIAAIVQHYRFTGDRAWLTKMYPVITHAVQHVNALRASTASDPAETRGLLPANFSAEDLGPADTHHYWDDFWTLAGLREAAFAARELGHPDDADSLSREATDFEALLMASIRLVDADSGKTVVPNGPEDLTSSAMARGTTPAVWPIAAIQDPDALFLIRSSFDTYFASFLAPQGGGFRHYAGTLWPYAGLGIAHTLLRLGKLPQVWQVLDWTMQHQTLTGAYAWGEAINPDNGGLELGDMPHSWAAAELISLLRDMLLAEQDGTLVVNGGAPDAWLSPGGHEVLRNAPTQYGVASVELLRNGAGDLSVNVHGSPPAGWHVRIPAGAQTLGLDGAKPTVFQDSTIVLPTGDHTVVVSYAGN
jgi:hypothetical protein